MKNNIKLQAIYKKCASALLCKITTGGKFYVKKIFELYKLDWLRIFKHPAALLLMIALMILPSLYAWFNIAALWDPYGNTSNLKIAVYSDDKPIKVEDKTINVGSKMMDTLKKNNKLGWTFVKSEKDLKAGVKDGTYYAGIYVPSHFSKDLLSFVKGKIQRPKLEYYVNQKINAIAPKITNTGASTLQDTITEEFIEAVSKTVIQVMNDIGYDLETNLPSITRLSSMILKLDENIDEVDNYTNEVLSLEEKLPELKQKLNKANAFMNYLPEANKIAQQVVELNGMLPEFEKAGNLIIELERHIPKIKQTGQQISQINQDFDQIVKVMDEGIDEANKALKIIEEVQAILPDIVKLGQQANQLVEGTQDILPKVEQGLDAVEKAVNAGILTTLTVADTVSSVSDTLEQWINQNELTEKDKETIKQSLTRMNSALDQGVTVLSSLRENLSNLQEAARSNALSDLLGQIDNDIAQAKQLRNMNQTLINSIDQLSAEQIKARLLAISKQANEFANAVQQLSDAGIKQQVTNLLNQLKEALTTADGVIDSANTVFIPKVDDLLTSTSKTIRSALDTLSAYRKEMPAIRDEISTADRMLNGNMDTITNGIQLGADFFRNDFSTVKTEMNNAAAFIQNDLPRIENELKESMAVINQKFPDVEHAITEASNLIRNDYPSLRKGIVKAADAIRKQQDSVDLREVIRLLKADAKAESDFLAKPIVLDKIDYYPIPNYGSASTPFYTALCLWVGALLFSSIATTEVTLSNEQTPRYSMRQKFTARMLTFLTVSVFQALIVAIGNLTLLDVYAHHPFYFIGFTLFVGLVFMTIVYVLVGLLGNIGKGLSIIVLVLSISGAGGNFPIELSGSFFQMINPYLPFTYAVNLLREAIGGIYWPNAIKDIAFLLLAGPLSIVIGIWIKPYAKPWVDKFNHAIDRSKLFH